MGRHQKNGGERETGHELGLEREGPVLPSPVGHLKVRYFYPDREGKTLESFEQMDIKTICRGCSGQWVRGRD